jgi:hypothetical protein
LLVAVLVGGGILYRRRRMSSTADPRTSDSHVIGEPDPIPTKPELASIPPTRDPVELDQDRPAQVELPIWREPRLPAELSEARGLELRAHELEAGILKFR